MTCNPMQDPERRKLRNAGTIYVWVVQRVTGFDNGGMPILGGIVEVLAYVSYFDIVAAVEKYIKEPNKYHVAKYQPPVRVGVTYAGPG